MSISFQRIFYTLASVFAIFAVLVIAKTILIPLGFALLLACILYPLARQLERWKFNRILAAFVAIVLLVLLSGGLIYFFFSQLFNLSGQLADFQTKILQLYTDLLHFAREKLQLNLSMQPGYLEKNGLDWMKNTLFPMAQNTFSSSTSFLTGLMATLIYTFLLLIYRAGIIRALVAATTQKHRTRVAGMLKRIQRVGQQYLGGMGLLILILGFANSIGLWIIGIDSPFLFGFLAAVMSVIPYIGTLLGAAIPVLYAFMAYDPLWMPLAVAGLFWGIQLIESNYLSPRVVGNSLQVNAFAAILSLLIGASVWGVSGMILFLPFTAMLKVCCEEFDDLKPFAMLIGNKIYRGGEEDTDPLTE